MRHVSLYLIHVVFLYLHLSGSLWKMSFYFLSSFPPAYCVHVCPEVQQPQSEGRLSINLINCFFIGSYYLKQRKWICLYNLYGSWYTKYIREVWLPKICWYSGTLRGELVSCLNSVSVHSKCSLRQNLLTLDSYQRKVNTWRMEAEGQQSNQ